MIENNNTYLSYCSCIIFYNTVSINTILVLICHKRVELYLASSASDILCPSPLHGIHFTSQMTTTISKRLKKAVQERNVFRRMEE